MLQYLIKPPKVKTEKAPLLVLLHGYGSNQDDLFGFAPQLPQNAYVVSFQAPHSLMYNSFAWYAIYFDQNSDKFSDIPQAQNSLQLIKASVEALCQEYPVDKDNITLIGFSQGAILSYALALSYPQMFKKIVALSGYFNAEMCLEGHGQNDFSTLQIFASHGTDDQVIPIDWARQSKETLLQKNIKLTYLEYPVGHGVAPQNFIDFTSWLTKL